ncbi:MAG: serine protease [Desulfobacteraceae bacterium]|nr:serine protease [Desulfobacteraceae bacterium]
MIKFIFNKIRNYSNIYLFSLCLLLAALAYIPVLTAEDAVALPMEKSTASKPPLIIPKIIGGEETQTSWPWITALVTRGDDNYYGQFCGGALIDSEWVVTASHCTEGSSASEIDVLIGQNALSGSGGERIEVDRIVMHPNFNTVTLDNDIALLHLKQTSTKDVLEILYSADEDLAAANTSATILGWGVTSYPYGSSPDDLYEAEITIFSDAYGQSIYGSEFTDNMITAGNKSGGVDTCQGDSGGPMIVANDDGSGWFLTGITSWGNGCAAPNSPGVYAKVVNYTDWIEETTGIESQNIPAKVTLSSPSGTISDSTPAYTWTAASNATWYKLYVWDANHNETISQWYEATNVCSGGTCTVTPSTTLSAGSYQGYLKSWNDSGSQWGSAVSFAMANSSDLPSQITLVSPSGTLAAGTATFVWNEDSKATWYKLYLNNTSETYKLVQWYEIENNYTNYPEVTCSSGTCSITISPALEDDAYEWWVMGWSSLGSGAWSSGTTFTVGQ